MASPRPESALSARQRFALGLLLVVALASFCVVLWKSRRQSIPATKTEQVTLTEFQTIPPVSATGEDSATGKSAKPKKQGREKSRKGKKVKGNQKRRQSGQSRQAPLPTRDITTETVSPR